MTAVRPAHLGFLVVINLIWGYNLIALKHGVGHFPPVFFSFLRFFVIAVLVLPYLRIKRGEMRWLLTASLFAGGLQFAVMFVGVALSRSMSSVAIAGQLGVPFVTILSVLLLGEKVRWRRRLGIALAFLGVMVMGFNPAVLQAWQGLALTVAAALISAFGLIAIKRLVGVKPLELQAWFAWTSLPVLLPLSLLLEDGQWQSIVTADWGDWGALAYASLAASLVAHTGFFWLVQRYPVTSIAPLTVLAPVFSVMFSAWLLGDVIDWRIIAGGAMTLTGVVIIAARERKMVDTGT